MRRRVLAAALALSWSAAAAGQQLHQTGIKWLRDSEEYATLTRQVYRLAGDAVTRAAAAEHGTPWAVVMDIDETTLDNSTYQLDRAAYGLPFENTSWNAWVSRKEAVAIPGVVDFIALVRKAGGHVAWISNRDDTVTAATRANLASTGLWNDDDRLCSQKAPTHTKGQRRHEVVTGTGDCAWPGKPMHVVAFVGDQLGDFPAADEAIPQTGTDAAFGRTCFLLPNPMYGSWTTQVTRK